MTTLTIAFVPGVSPAKWARVWRERFPEVDLALRPIGADGVDEALAGQVDMAFARMPVGDAHHAIPLWTETAVVAMPKDADLAALDELTAADLDGVHVVDAGPVPADIDGTLDLVEANVGVAVLPQSLFRAASRKPLVGRPLVDAPGTRIALVWRDADAGPLTEDFIGVVRGRTANSSRGDTLPGGTDPDDGVGSAPAGGRSGTSGTAKSGKGSAGGKATAGGKGAGGKATAGGKSSGGKGSGGKGARAGRTGGAASGRGRSGGLGRGKPRRGQKGNR